VGHGTLRDEQKIILNTASEVELCKLPGVGTKKAQAILALREKLGGRFKRLEDLYRVKGIKRRFLERIKPHVLLDPPADPPAEESEKKEK
jgi:competence protein ComEA